MTNEVNQDKTELIVVAPKHRIKHLSECSLSLSGTIVPGQNLAAHHT
jgi:hypothetical protein